MWNGIYDLYEFSPRVVDYMRIPPAVHGYLLIVLLVPFVPQRWVRPFILYTGLLFMWLFMGVPFAAGVVGACLFLHTMTRALASWARATGNPRPATAVGWIVIHLSFLPFFYVNLPHIPGMQAGELTQFCGVGFMVLKTSHYVWDACRGNISDMRLSRFLLFMTYLPTFRLGPLDRFEHFNGEMNTCKTRISRSRIAYGLYRVAIGTTKMLFVGFVLEKKFFGDPYSIPFGQAFFDGGADLSVGAAWMLSYLLFFRLYLIFSGYTDGAIGMSVLMGIRTPENFHRPLLTTNIQAFWRRWHMSMSTWLRDYIYIPLGGKNSRTNMAVFGVFLYCGLWHFPTIAGPWIFAVLQTVSLAATRKWHDYVLQGRERAGGVLSILRRLGLVDGIPAWILGWLITWNIMVFSMLLVFDHHRSGFQVIPRLFGY